MKRQPACYQRSLPAILATAFVILTGAGCSTAPHLTGIVHEGPQGTVYLEEIPDLYFEAHHPASLSTPAAARLLEGVQVQQADQDMAAEGEHQPAPVPAFTPTDVGFLAPLLAQALERARPEQHVAFRSMHSDGSDSRVTAGTLYVYGPKLYFTLTHYRQVLTEPDRGTHAKRALPSSSKLGRFSTTFDPETAGRPAIKLPRGAPRMPTLTTLMIDPSDLDGLPAVASAPPVGNPTVTEAGAAAMEDMAKDPLPTPQMDAAAWPSAGAMGNATLDPIPSPPMEAAVPPAPPPMPGPEVAVIPAPNGDAGLEPMTDPLNGETAGQPSTPPSEPMLPEFNSETEPNDFAAYTAPENRPANGAPPPDAYRVKLQELQEANRLLGEKMAEQKQIEEDLRIVKEKLRDQRKRVRRMKAMAELLR